MKVSNSTFEKQERLIVGMYTMHPELTPQYYTFVEPLGGGFMRSSKFTFDGQVFTRDKKHGGNLTSSWCISGTGKSKREIKESKEEFRKFKNMLLTLSVLGKDPIIEIHSFESMLERLG